MPDKYECQPESWSHPPDDDDDYQAELHLERKGKEGWTLCRKCGVWLHLKDHEEGSAFCDCEEEEEE